MKENDYRFGNFVFQLREEKGMTQAELAARLDVTAAAVSKWENGESKPRTEKLFELAELLGVSAEELIAGERRPAAPQTVVIVPDGSDKFRRILAWAVDGIVLFFLIAVVSALTAAGFTLSAKGSDQGVTFKMFYILLNLFTLYLIFRDAVCAGRSLGKRICGLEIIEEDRRAEPGYGRLIVRNLFFFLSLPDFILLLVKGRTVGDYATGTVVVRKGKYDAAPRPPKKSRKIIGVTVTAGVIALIVLSGFLTAQSSRPTAPSATQTKIAGMSSSNYDMMVRYVLAEYSTAYPELEENDIVLRDYFKEGSNGEHFTFRLGDQTTVDLSLTHMQGQYFVNNSPIDPNDYLPRTQ